MANRLLRHYRYENQIQLPDGTAIHYKYWQINVHGFRSHKPLNPDRYAWLVSRFDDYAQRWEKIAGSEPSAEWPNMALVTLEEVRAAIARVVAQEHSEAWVCND